MRDREHLTKLFKIVNKVVLLCIGSQFTNYQSLFMATPIPMMIYIIKKRQSLRTDFFMDLSMKGSEF